MNATQQSGTKWFDSFVLALRVKQVGGAAIGDAVASVESYCAESGETPLEAFGEPEAYAHSLSFPPEALDSTTPLGWLRILLPTVCGVVGLALTTAAVRGFRTGEAPHVSWGAVASLAVLASVVGMMVAMFDRILRSRVGFALLFGGSLALMVGLAIGVSATAFTLPVWVASCVAVVLLVLSVVLQLRQAGALMDPVVDPRGQGSVTKDAEGVQGRMVAFSAWQWVVISALLGVLTWVTS